jgi:hypothetical protein
MVNYGIGIQQQNDSHLHVPSILMKMLMGSLYLKSNPRTPILTMPYMKEYFTCHLNCKICCPPITLKNNGALV